MEEVAVAVADEHVALVAHVNAVGEVGDVLAADATQKATARVKHAHAVALEVAHEVVVAVQCEIGRLAHMRRAVEPGEHRAGGGVDAEHGRRDAVDDDDLVVTVDDQAGYDVDVLDGDLLEEAAALVEQLHARAAVAHVAHHVRVVAHHGHLARIVQLAGLATRASELVLELAALGEHLDAVVVGVGDHDVVVVVEAEAVRFAEVARGRARLAERELLFQSLGLGVH